MTETTPTDGLVHEGSRDMRAEAHWKTRPVKLRNLSIWTVASRR